MGQGGEPGSSYCKCEPLGYVSIVQESNKATPDAAAGGGSLLFRFDALVTVRAMAMLDIDEDTALEVVVTKSGGAQVMLTTGWTGDNGVYSLPIDQTNVKQVLVVRPPPRIWTFYCFVRPVKRRMERLIS